MDDDHDRHVVDSFREEGGGLSYVLDIEDATPSYTCTYGWSVTYDLPEMIAFDTQVMALRTLAPLFDALLDARDAGTAITDGARWPMRFNDRPVVGRFVHPGMVSGGWFTDALRCREMAGRGDPMPAYQLFWADRDGRYPWDAGASGVCRILQPLLYRAPTPGGWRGTLARLLPRR